MKRGRVFMKTCPKCGTACYDNDVFCGSCGYQFSENKISENSAQNTAGNDVNAQRDKTEGTGYGAKNETAGCGFDRQNNAVNGGYGPRYGTGNSGYGARNSSACGSYGANANPNSAYTANSPKDNTFAIVSLVLGIISIPTIWCCGLGFLLAVAAIVFGCIARGQIKESNGRQTGIGYCTAGLVLGIISIVLFAIAIVAIVALNAWSTIFNDITSNENSFETGLMLLGLF